MRSKAVICNKNHTVVKSIINQITAAESVGGSDTVAEVVQSVMGPVMDPTTAVTEIRSRLQLQNSMHVRRRQQRVKLMQPQVQQVLQQPFSEISNIFASLCSRFQPTE